MIIIIDEYGVQLERQNASFLLSKETGQQLLSPHRVTAIHVRKPCTISSAAILLAIEHGVAILFFGNNGKVQGRTWQTNFGSHARIRHHQMALAKHHQGHGWVSKGIQAKAQAQTSVLDFLAGNIPGTSPQMQTAIQKILSLAAHPPASPASPEAIRAWEAGIARTYWEAYFGALEHFQPADKRSRRPARDPLNALLNYTYGMLYGEVETAALSAGLDPQIGILHREEYGKPAFVFDAIEPYRPWVDQLVAELALEGKINSEWFEAKPVDQPTATLTEAQAMEDGPERQTLDSHFWLSKAGKTILIPAWIGYLNATTPFEGKKASRKTQIQTAMTALAQYLLHDFQP